MRFIATAKVAIVDLDRDRGERVAEAIRQASGFTKTRARWSEVSWRCRANSGGSAAEIVLSGDMA